MTLLARLGLIALVIAILAFIFAFFRRLGWGEVGLIAAVFALVFGIESVRFIVKQFIKGYREADPPELKVRAKRRVPDKSD